MEEMNTANPRPVLRPDPQANSTLSVKKVISTTTWGGRAEPPMKVNVIQDQSGEISYLPSIKNCIQNQEASNLKYVVVLQNKKKIKQQKSKLQENIEQKFLKIPYYYIGIDKESYFIIKILEKNMNIPSHHVLLCLKKIKLNNSFRELGDDFSLPPNEALNIFHKNIPLLAKIMQKFIVKLEFLRNVSCIIDCLEIQIGKPSISLIQKQTWSEHKNANTVKYLLSCNPNGLVNYVSTGYGGRISDTYLVQTCGFTKHLRPRMSIMFNREFENLEEYFIKHNIKVLRSSSIVEADGIIVGQNPKIESYFKTVMGRLQGFAMLSPNACINRNIKLLDDVVSIACGLMNLQDNTLPTRRYGPKKLMIDT